MHARRLFYHWAISSLELKAHWQITWGGGWIPTIGKGLVKIPPQWDLNGLLLFGAKAAQCGGYYISTLSISRLKNPFSLALVSPGLHHSGRALTRSPKADLSRAASLLLKQLFLSRRHFLLCIKCFIFLGCVWVLLTSLSGLISDNFSVQKISGVLWAHWSNWVLLLGDR